MQHINLANLVVHHKSNSVSLLRILKKFLAHQTVWTQLNNRIWLWFSEFSMKIQVLFFCTLGIKDEMLCLAYLGLLNHNIQDKLTQECTNEPLHFN
jgi:hypothetical protein